MTALSSIPGTISILLITTILTLLELITPPKIDLVQSNSWGILILIATTAVIITWNGGVKALGVINSILFVNLVPIITFTIGYLRGNDISQVEILGAFLTIMALIANNFLSRKSIITK